MYYIVSNESELGKRYLDHKAEQMKFFDFAEKFLKENGVQSNEYGICSNLMIVPTEEDIRKFENQLQQPKKAGRNCYFRANSKLSKAWHKGLEEAKIDVKLISRSGALWGYIPHASGRWNIFDIEGVIYFHFEPTWEDKINFSKTDFTEIKASEYFKVIEDYNQRIKEKKEEI